MPLQRPEPDAGFTLFETLVAFAVLALSITVIYQVGITTLGNSARQHQRYEMTEFARSQLDEIVELGSDRAQDGIYRDTWDWVTKVEPVGGLQPSYLDKSHYIARITITVTPHGRSKPIVSLFTEDFRRLP